MAKKNKRTYRMTINGNEVWDSGLRIYEPVVKVERTVVDICNSVNTRFRDSEFSIMFKVEERNNLGRNVIFVSGDYYIPPQVVGPASVDYDEDIEREIAEKRKEGYNCILHKHPNGIRTFSHSDITSICMHFDISLLYIEGEIVYGTMKVPYKDGMILLVPKIEIVNNMTIEISGIENIKRREYDINNVPNMYSNNYYGTLFGMGGLGRSLKDKKRKKGVITVDDDDDYDDF